MAVSSLVLLGQPSQTALRTIVQELTIPEVNVNHLAIARPSVETGNQMSVRVGVDGAAYESGEFPYFGAVTVTYQRLDYEATFGPLALAFNVVFPTTTSRLIQFLEDALAIEFSEDDYVEELIVLQTPLTDRTYVLKAGVNSPRWIGQTTIQLHRAE